MKLHLVILSFILTSSVLAQPTEGLIAYYEMNNDATDSSLNNFDGTMIGPSTNIDRFGIANNALSFDGLNDLLLIPDASQLRLSESFTIAFWVLLPEIFTNEGAYSILSKRATIDQDGYALQIIGSNHPTLIPGQLSFLASGGQNSSQSNSAITLGQWNHVLLEFDSSENLATWYLNNEEAGTSIIESPNPNTNVDLKIGRDDQSSVNSFWFSGVLDDLIFYNRTLSVDEKEQIFELNSLVASVDISQEILCHGDTTGEIQIQATGGSESYTYSIDGGVSFQDSNIFSNLSAGNYQVVVMDSQGTTQDLGDLTINQPPPLSATIELSEVPTVLASGGTPDYEYSLDGSIFQMENTFPNLQSGTYTITVRDSNGCTLELDDFAVINNIENLNSLEFDIFPNPTEDFLTVYFSQETNAETIEVISIKGESVHLSNFQTDNKIDVRHLLPALYILLVRDDSGRVIAKSKIVKLGYLRP